MTFNKFYQQPIDRRRHLVEAYQSHPLGYTPMSDEIGDRMVENYLYPYSLPLGVAQHFKINDRDYLIPMAIEEPSVIAAASNGAKRLGNIQAEAGAKVLTGQMILIPQTDRLPQDWLADRQEAWLDIARQASPSMVRRGGGPLALRGQRLQKEATSYDCYYLDYDPVDAMGANQLNQVLEWIGPIIAQETQGDLLMAILSNHSPDSLITARAKLPVSSLNSNHQEAFRMAHRIVQASDYAQLDPYRAVTHNKGIMNGVDALMIATGNDWRAIEAGVHAYACHGGKYQPLSHWTLSADDQYLLGEIVLPLQVATVGGTLAVHPNAQWSLHLLGQPDARTLGKIAASLGLAQNFAALRALVGQGIQQGHMALHARSLALQVGAQSDEIDRLVEDLQGQNLINRQVAKELLDKIRYSLDNEKD